MSESNVEGKEKGEVKKSKRTQKLCTLQCEWENCNSTVTLTPGEYSTFSDHLKIHADEFVARISSELVEDDKALSCCCMWRECSWEGCEDLNDLIRHIMFHGYHTLLRSLGSLVQSKLDLTPCSIEVDDQYHMFSCVTTSYICCWKECSTEFTCPNQYYRHVEKHVMGSAGVYNDDKQLRMQCLWNDCLNQFRDKHKLKEHTRVHTHEKMFACPGCGGLFSNRTKLLDHLSRQNAAAYENYQCSHCLKRCASERLLRDHMRHHVNYLKCPHCDMTCPNPGSLKYHIHYRHSDERPYACNMCEQKFKSNSDLIRHEESHLEKSYVCSEDGCSYSTKTAHCLRRHIKITHSGSAMKRYVCHVCNRAYSRGFGLTKHLKKQHDFSWPSGHPRFRYIEYDDGLFRLQMVRFESAELTKRLLRDSPDIHLDGYEDEEVVETHYTAGGAHERKDKESVSQVEETDEESTATAELESDIYVTISETPNSAPNIAENISSEAKIVQIVGATGDVAENNTVTNLYLQPKPPGYDSTVMAQLLALSSKPNNTSSNQILVDELYQRLLKRMNDNKQNEHGETTDDLTVVQHVDNLEHSDIMFQQVAVSDDQVLTVAMTDENAKLTEQESVLPSSSEGDEKCLWLMIETSPNTHNTVDLEDAVSTTNGLFDTDNELQRGVVIEFEDNNAPGKRKLNESTNTHSAVLNIENKRQKSHNGLVTDSGNNSEELGEKLYASQVLLSLTGT